MVHHHHPCSRWEAARRRTSSSSDGENRWTEGDGRGGGGLFIGGTGAGWEVQKHKISRHKQNSKIQFKIQRLKPEELAGTSDCFEVEITLWLKGKVVSAMAKKKHNSSKAMH